MPNAESLLSTSEVLKILNVPSYKLDYLFKSRKLKPEDFTTLGTGQSVYKHSDPQKPNKHFLMLCRNEKNFIFNRKMG